MRRSSSLIWLLLVGVAAMIYWGGCDNDTNTLKPISYDDDDTEAPAVYIVAPEDGDSVPEGEYCHVVPEITDDGTITKAELYVDNDKRGEVLRSPYEFDFYVSAQYPDHNYEIYVMAYDKTGKSGKSPTITVRSYTPESE